MSTKDKKGGPPRCVYCNSIMEGWTRKWVDDNSLIWICPNYCSFKDVTVPIKQSLEQDIENPMIGMLPNLEEET